ncbi:MAG: hypothetical protein QXQ94_06265 [Candidatus Bathyarchaeia archaeon]
MTSSLNEIKSISLALTNSNFEENKILLDNICSEIASRFNLYQSNGKPHKSTIIETLAKSTCLACVAKWFSDHVNNKVDTIYKECHKLAVNVLVEELYHFLNQLGYKVVISTEEELEYGKADILIEVTNYGLNLKSKAKELLIEVKTGDSLSLIQIFRYLWDSRSNAIVVWRVRKRQVLTFDPQKIEPLLTESMRMICLRGIRLLSSPQIHSCQHLARATHQPAATELELMFQDFAKAIIETLPSVLQRVLEQLAINKTGVVGQT